MKRPKGPKQKSDLPVKELFSHRGWHLERGILESDLTVGTREFLGSRQTSLQKLFEEWVDLRPDGAESYAWHQKQLRSYVQRGIPKDLRHFLRGEFDLETRLDLRIMKLVSTGRCIDFFCEFLQTEHYYIHYPPMIRFKIAGAESSLVPVHQDLAYNRHLVDFVTMWVPLVDIDEECGGIIAYEGSHLGEIAEHEASGAWANRAMTDPTRYPSRHITMGAGDALLFPPTLLHESAPHRSVQIRYSIDFRIIRCSSDTTKSYYDPFTRSVARVDEGQQE